jgi:hypothetical protein
MKGKQKKKLVNELKGLSEKQKIKMILYLMDQIKFLRLASNMQTELIETMVDSQKAAAMGETFQ